MTPDLIAAIVLGLLVICGLGCYFFILYSIISKLDEEECVKCPMRDQCFNAMIIGRPRLCQCADKLDKSQIQK